MGVAGGGVWEGEVDVHRTESVEKNEYLKDLELQDRGGGETPARATGTAQQVSQSIYVSTQQQTCLIICT